MLRSIWIIQVVVKVASRKLCDKRVMIDSDASGLAFLLPVLSCTHYCSHNTYQASCATVERHDMTLTTACNTHAHSTQLHHDACCVSICGQHITRLLFSAAWKRSAFSHALCAPRPFLQMGSGRRLPDPIYVDTSMPLRPS